MPDTAQAADALLARHDAMLREMHVDVTRVPMTKWQRQAYREACELWRQQMKMRARLGILPRASYIR